MYKDFCVLLDFISPYVGLCFFFYFFFWYQEHLHVDVFVHLHGGSDGELLDTARGGLEG